MESEGDESPRPGRDLGTRRRRRLWKLWRKREKVAGVRRNRGDAPRQFRVEITQTICPRAGDVLILRVPRRTRTVEDFADELVRRFNVTVIVLGLGQTLEALDDAEMHAAGWTRK